MPTRTVVPGPASPTPRTRSGRGAGGSPASTSTGSSAPSTSSQSAQPAKSGQAAPTASTSTAPSSPSTSRPTFGSIAAQAKARVRQPPTPGTTRAKVYSTAHAADGLLFGLFAYAVGMAYVRDGWPGVVDWGRAKFFNQPTQGKDTKVSV